MIFSMDSLDSGQRIYSLQGGRSWQPFGEGKNSHKSFLRRVFAIFTFALFLRIIANGNINSV